jgi:inosine-uridine nucleoside N-ribohydrolase
VGRRSFVFDSIVETQSIPELKGNRLMTETIDFKRNKAILIPKSLETLSNVVEWLSKQPPDLCLVVEAHCFPLGKFGNPEKEFKLTHQRKNAVIEELARLGLARERMFGVGHGCQKPPADPNASAMRVELTILKPDEFLEAEAKAAAAEVARAETEAEDKAAALAEASARAEAVAAAEAKAEAEAAEAAAKAEADAAATLSLARKKRLIIDTDVGADDAVAIIMAACAPHLCEIVAITTVFGNISMEQATENAETLLKALQHPRVSIFPGAQKALVRNAKYKQWEGHGKNGMGDATFDEVDLSTSWRESEHAAIALVRLVKEFPGEMDIVALGPLTNIAIAIALDPCFVSRVKSLTIMGGSTASRGNASLCGEFNFFCDPDAAHSTVHHFACQTIKTTLVPWDVCENTALSWRTFDQLTCGRNRPSAILKRINAAYENHVRYAGQERATPSSSPLPPLDSGKSSVVNGGSAAASPQVGAIVTNTQDRNTHAQSIGRRPRRREY